jgi:hypothetical protein
MEYEIGADEPVSEAVVRAASAIDGRQPAALLPLADVLDPDALDALFDAKADGEPRVGGRLSFVYNHCRVTVDNGEFLTIRPLEND